MPGSRGLHELLEAAVGAGVDAVQIRAKEATDRALFDLTTLVVDRLRLLGATVIVNDRLDVALGAGTDGVHLGLADLPVRPVRHLAPQGFLVSEGRSAELESDNHPLRQRITRLEGELSERTDTLDAARAMNRELMNELNRGAPGHDGEPHSSARR